MKFILELNINSSDPGFALANILHQEAETIAFATGFPMNDKQSIHDAAGNIVGFWVITDTQWGCHCDLDPGQKPDECVIGTENSNDCIRATRYSKKEECEYWKAF